VRHRLVAQRDGPAWPSRRLIEGDRASGRHQLCTPWSAYCPASSFTANDFECHEVLGIAANDEIDEASASAKHSCFQIVPSSIQRIRDAMKKLRRRCKASPMKNMIL